MTDSTRDKKITELFDMATHLRHIVDYLHCDNQFSKPDVHLLEDAVAYINTADMDERVRTDEHSIKQSIRNKKKRN